MKKEKRPYIKKDFESDCNPSDVSANIYESMMLSEAWLALTAKQKVLYIACKLQYYSEKKKPQMGERPDKKKYEARILFTMNQHKWLTKYKLYNKNDEKSFYRDRNALIEYGFIDYIENGKVTRTKSIYRLSSRWRNYQKH